MDLHGWDTSYATSATAINDALAVTDEVLDNIEFTRDGVALHCRLGSWRIISGGAGELLHLEIPILSGCVGMAGNPGTDLAGIAVQLEINLRFLPSDVSNHQQLNFNFQSVGVFGTPSAPGAVTPLRVIDPDQRLAFQEGAVLCLAIAQCLVERADAISFKFAEINLVAPDTANSWLTPVECAYAFYQTGDGDAYLVVLSSTSKRDVSGLSRKIDPALFAGSGEGYFAISKQMFLTHALLPLLPQVYPGNDASHFVYNAKHGVIKNSKPVSLAGVKSGLIWYYPKLTSLTIEIRGANVITKVTGVCDMYLGFNCTFSVSATSHASFDSQQGSLVFSKDPNPTSSHQAKIPWYAWLGGAITSAVIAIVVPAIAGGIATGLGAGLKTLGLSATGPLNVKWPGMQTFTATAGHLADAFQLAGTTRN